MKCFQQTETSPTVQQTPKIVQEFFAQARLLLLDLCVSISHLSCPSLFLVFLFRLAILDLWVVFRAGPTLMDVFSNGVAEMDTLAPL